MNNSLPRDSASKNAMENPLYCLSGMRRNRPLRPLKRSLRERQEVRTAVPAAAVTAQQLLLLQ